MTHVRTLARTYVANKLLGHTDAGQNVSRSKVTPNKDKFPAISVYTTNEARDEVVSNSPYEQNRIINLEIQCEIQASTPGYDDKLDAICEQVENLVDFKLGGEIAILKSCEYKETQLLYKDDGAFITALALMTYEITYFAAEKGLVDPETLSTLSKFYTEWQLDGETAKADEVPVT